MKNLKNALEKLEKDNKAVEEAKAHVFSAAMKVVFQYLSHETIVEVRKSLENSLGEKYPDILKKIREDLSPEAKEEFETVYESVKKQYGLNIA